MARRSEGKTEASIEVGMPLAMKEKLEAERTRLGYKHTSDFVRERLGSAIGWEGSHPAVLPLLGKAPCGPLREAVDGARAVDIGDAAQWLRALPGDFLIEADGWSMVSPDARRSIPHRALLLMRPNLDARGRVALVRLVLGNGECLFTIKKFDESSAGRLVLRDGRGRAVPLSGDIERAEAVGVMVGMLAPLEP
ncbi:MAG TPA: hypothetical protein VNM48_20705 [Chloroflexota bacterium]|nr:hypothetical protein [Chloroflexota bacterium]